MCARSYFFIQQKQQQNCGHVLPRQIGCRCQTGQKDETKVSTNNKDFIFKPADLGLNRISQQSIFGGNSIKEAAKIFVDILNLRGTKEQVNVVLANSALAISTYKGININDAYEIAKKSLKDKDALQALSKLIELSR